MKINLPYGSGNINLNVPDTARKIEPKPAFVLPDTIGAVQNALDHPIGSPPLNDLAAGRRNACIVISDVTRPVPNRMLLPPILNTLNRAGLSPTNILILIATGTHRPNQGQELIGLVGREVADHYQVTNHHCRQQGLNIEIDKIEGTSIEIDRRYLEADLKILTGLIELHGFAGYSGGGKSILPGLSSFETMKFMHSYAMLEHPHVRVCSLKHNPFQQHIRRVARKAGVDFLVNAAINKSRELTGVFAGDLEAAHDEGCRMVEDHVVVPMDEEADFVITTGAGLPLDATFVQAIKGLEKAKEITRPGGKALLIAECSQGLGGETFGSILDSAPTPEAFSSHYRQTANFAFEQWVVHVFYRCKAHFDEILVYSPGLTTEDFQRLNVTRVADLQEAVNSLASQFQKIVVIPEGPYVMGQARGGPEGG